MKLPRLQLPLPFGLFSKLRNKQLGPAKAYQVVRTSVARGYLTAIVSKNEFSGETLFPFFAHVVSPRHARTRIWLYLDDENLVPHQALAIPARVRKSLQLEMPNPVVQLRVPNRSLLEVRAPPALDLPSGAEVHVSELTYKNILTSRHVRRHALLTTADGVFIPVRVRKRNIDPDVILVPMSLRTLGGIERGSDVQLSAIPKIFLSDQREAASRRIIIRRPRNRLVKLLAVSFGYLLMGIRILDVCAELLLRAAFRSQTITFRVIQAHPGDDDLRDTIRLHPGAFGALGLRPGGQVLLSWGRQRMAVRALEDQKPFDGAFSSHVMKSVGLRLDATPLSSDFPAHLIARLPAPVRRTLNIPPNTVVEMRRKLRPALIDSSTNLPFQWRASWRQPRRFRRSEDGRWCWAEFSPWFSAWHHCACPAHLEGHGREESLRVMMESMPTARPE